VGRWCEPAAAARDRREGLRGRVGLGEEWRHWRGFGLGGGDRGGPRIFRLCIQNFEVCKFFDSLKPYFGLCYLLLEYIEAITRFEHNIIVS
jgi:hypothetical protein